MFKRPIASNDTLILVKIFCDVKNVLVYAQEDSKKKMWFVNIKYISFLIFFIFWPNKNLSTFLLSRINLTMMAIGD